MSTPREQLVRAMHAEVCCPCDPGTVCDVAKVYQNRYAVSGARGRLATAGPRQPNCSSGELTTMKITGHVTGTSRDDLLAQATEETIQFFGTPCVQVNLYNAVAETQEVEARTLWEPTTQTVFRADYAGAERHGTGACGRCKEMSN